MVVINTYKCAGLEYALFFMTFVKEIKEKNKAKNGIWYRFGFYLDKPA